MATPRQIRRIPVVDVLIPGLIKLLPSYYSKRTCAKFVVGDKIYLHVADDSIIRHFAFKDTDQWERFIDEWKRYSQPNKS